MKTFISAQRRWTIKTKATKRILSIYFKEISLNIDFILDVIQYENQNLKRADTIKILTYDVV